MGAYALAPALWQSDDLFISTRRRSQVVRQRSAKPLFIGSIPIAASNKINFRDFCLGRQRVTVAKIVLTLLQTDGKFT